MYRSTEQALLKLLSGTLPAPHEVLFLCHPHERDSSEAVPDL